MDTSIDNAAINSIKENLLALVNSFISSMTTAGAGTGTVSQLLSSVINTMDCIMLGFVGAAVCGFIVLILYTQKVIIGFIT